MKKYLITAITVSILVITGCYNDNRNVTIRINLGNIPIAKNIQKKTFMDRVLSVFVKDAYAQSLPTYLTKVHIAAYKNRSLLAYKSIDAADLTAEYLGSETNIVSYVDLEIPSGDNLDILVVGEIENISSSFKGAGYYGVTNTDIKPGITNNVLVDMVSALWDGVAGTITTNIDCPNTGPTNPDVSWTPAAGKVKYIIINKDTETQIYYNDKTGWSAEFNADENYYQYLFYVEFEDFNIRTVGEHIFPGCG